MPDSKQTQRTPQCNRTPKPVSAGISGASDESAVEADGGDERKRNLPITVSAFISALTTIYCLTIWFGNVQPTAVPALIILSS